MAQTKLFLVQFLISVDVSEWPDFDEVKAAEHFRSGLNLTPEDKLLQSQVYLLARNPHQQGDLLIEEYEDGDYGVEIYQNADTVGTDVPTYFYMIYNTQVANPASYPGDDYPTVEEVKEAARIKVEKRAAKLQARRAKAKEKVDS